MSARRTRKISERSWKMSYKVRLPVFEGPFDLLVYLIENARMSIYDIRISEITGQYLEYIQTMRELNVNVASEFMVLAAELLRIKSKMMLPGVQDAGGNVVEEDPRSDLVRRLVEYRKCRAAAGKLAEAENVMEDVFTKPQEDISAFRDNPEEYLRLDIQEFARAFRQFLHRKRRLERVRRHYSVLRRDRETQENRMRYIRELFLPANTGRAVTRRNFAELVPDGGSRRDVIVSFLSVLQMTRDHYLDVEQKSLYGEIFVMNGGRSLEHFVPRAETFGEEGGEEAEE